MVRTKQQIRSSKAKGSALEYKVKESLEKFYFSLRSKGNIVSLTKELGFQDQYDVKIWRHESKEYIAIECKDHKVISWNQAKKWFLKLEKVTPGAGKHYLVFHTNRQPHLVMFRDDGIVVQEFEELFGVKCQRWKGVKE